MPENFLDNVLASSVVLLAFLVLMGLVFTVWSYLKMRKKRQYFEKVHKELKVGQEVMFGGGIFGTVKEVDGDRVAVKVRSGAVLDVSRYAIQEID
ncbi:MAG TPA: preprotein translocase subunit YajC [Candidatus Olsenella pullistercoris]|uniref:Preprotein translocase subunit YajC n=1 Tax=Candidatus Olsenella pullistercoris TaxID=2838712 RepID=A0A9D2JEE2_9ACTN|nr:preprotein translocase subunit YajC [Candidatus Olsenella pullistercoris]